MNPAAASLATASLIALAAVGVTAGLLRRDPVATEPPGDPLEDRRLSLLRSLADLEEARTAGLLEEPEYVRLREQTEGRMARVLRALDRRQQATQSPAPADGRSRGPRRVPAWAVALLVSGTVLAMVVAALVRESRPERATASTPASSSEDPLAFFEQRVREHPDDLAARLDLAHRYLDASRVEEALEHYGAALELDPDDAEAHAHVGMILYLAGRPEEALASVDRALRTDPAYPEALFFRGLILLRGLDRPSEAIDAFERYLDAAPFGSERATARELIDEARAAASA